MAVTTYSQAEIGQLFDDLRALTPRQQKLARTLILLGLTQVELDTDVAIEIHEPSGVEDDDELPLDVLFEHVRTHGRLPERHAPIARKVGHILTIGTRRPAE